MRARADFPKLVYHYWKLLSSKSYLPGVLLYPAQAEMLQHARALFRAEEAKDLRSLVAGKIGGIRHFDVAGMERAVAIIMGGRTGSVLLASYFDGHDDVMMLPLSVSTLYNFFDHYRSLPLFDKLITYPIFLNLVQPEVSFFQGEFPIAAADYYAAVIALFEVHGNSSPEFLGSSRAFFLFLHVAYCVALGRLPASPRPLIVYAQHLRHDELARLFVADFPQARFIHTVRDPITNCGRYFISSRRYLAPAHVIRLLTASDIPHSGMESRTRTIRFEDLHLHLEKTMRALADWLGIACRPSLLDSTFNGVPWVIKRGTDSWSGPRPEQAIRDSRNISFTDKGLLFAVLNEDFVAWNYACPAIFRHALVRVLTCMLVLLIPMRMEIINARNLIKNLPSLRRGGLLYAIAGLVMVFVCRIAVMSLLAVELCRRLVFGKKVLAL